MEGERQRNFRKLREERGWESSEEEEDITVIGLQQRTRSAGSVSDESDESEDDEVLVNEGEEQEEVDESAFEKLMTSALKQPRYI